MGGERGMEFASAMVGVGAGDLQHAVRAEVRRIIKETNGDALAQSKLLNERLRELRLINEADVEALNTLSEIGHETGAGKRDAREAYFESRDVYNTLLAGGSASPVALGLASSAVGAYSIKPDSDGSARVVFAKSKGAWEDRLGKAGAVIGAYWGVPGAVIGGAIGGAAGAAVDECLD
jgi:hypothetical protein